MCRPFLVLFPIAHVLSQTGLFSCPEGQGSDSCIASEIVRRLNCENMPSESLGLWYLEGNSWTGVDDGSYFDLEHARPDGTHSLRMIAVYLGTAGGGVSVLAGAELQSWTQMEYFVEETFEARPRGLTG